MRITAYIFLILILVTIYLNRSYSYFYSYIGNHPLINPNIKKEYVFNQAKTTPIIYIALGDSLTSGVGVDNYQESFPYLVASNLANNKSYLVLKNLSYPGFETKDVLNIEVPVAIKEKPDYVTLLIGINDVHNLVSAQDFKNNYLKIVKSLKVNTKSQLTLLNIPALGSSKILLFPHNLIYNSRVKEFNQIIYKIANENNLKYIDIYQKTDDSFKNDSSYYSNDLFHPSSKGYQLWEQFINAD